MTADYAYWKKAYESLWPKPGEREETIVEIIENLAGKGIKQSILSHHIYGSIHGITSGRTTWSALERCQFGYAEYLG